MIRCYDCRESSCICILDILPGWISMSWRRTHASMRWICRCSYVLDMLPCFRCVYLAEPNDHIFLLPKTACLFRLIGCYDQDLLLSKLGKCPCVATGLKIYFCITHVKYVCEFSVTWRISGRIWLFEQHSRMRGHFYGLLISLAFTCIRQPNYLTFSWNAFRKATV
jgi:hypothetical protein